jgi:O-antigen/teichoic acid export membrane protein
VSAVRGEVRTAFGNMLWKAVSLPLDKICRLALVVVSAPLLGEAAFGRFQFAATVTTVLALGTDLGLGIWTTRALARGRTEVATIVRTGLRVKTLAALPYALVTAVVAAAMGPGDERAALLLLGGSALVSGYIDHFAAIFRGCERFRDETRVNAARSVLLLAGGLGALAVQRSLVALAAGMTAGSLAGGLYGLSLIRHAAGPRPAWDPALARLATREGLPIWLAGMFSLLYFKGDAVILRLAAGDAALGAYSAAYKIFEGAMLVPAIVLAAAFPPLARAHGDRARQRSWERLVVAVLLVLGLGVGAVCYFGRTLIIARVFRAGFADAVPSLRVLALGLPLLFLNYGLTHFLIARDLGRKNLVFSAAMLVLNVALNLVLIPRAGGPGAAWATVLTELALTGCCLWTLRSAPEGAAHRPTAPAGARTGRMTG